MAVINTAGFKILNHSPYSHDLGPSDFYLRSILKNHLRGQKFKSDNYISAVQAYLDCPEKEFFFRRIKMLEHRLSNCIEVKGNKK